MAQVQPGLGGTLLARAEIQTQRRFVCEVRRSWSDPWERLPYLEPLSYTDAVMPSVGRATFRLRYGRIKREDRSAFEQFYDFDGQDWYVRILRIDTHGTAVKWLGVIDADQLMPHGGAIASGDLQLEAYGIVHELDRQAILHAQVLDGRGLNADGVRIEHVPDINLRYERSAVDRVFGNRSTEPDSNGVYLFAADGEEWTNLQAAEMILARYTSGAGPAFTLGGQKEILAQLVEVHRIAGLSPWQALQRLIPRGRGLGVAPLLLDDEVVLYVYTCLEQAVSAGGITIPANTLQRSLGTTDAIDQRNVTVTRSSSNLYDEIEVRAENRCLVCMTLGYRDGTLAERWSSDLQARYIAGASGESSYSGMSDAEKTEANDRARQDPLLDEVFTKHGLPASWDGQAGSGDGGVRAPALLACSDDGSVQPLAGAPYFPLGKRFETWLPLEEGKDYLSNPPVDLTPDDLQASFLRPFAFVESPDVDGLYYAVNKVGPEFDGANAQVKIYPRDAAIGIEPAPQHLYALGSYDPDNDPPATDAPVFNYGTLIATVALRTDDVLRVVARRAGVTDNPRVRRKVIVIPDAEYWYLVPGTVVGLNAGGTLRRAAGGVLRNDVERLRQASAFALAWYGRERAALTIEQLDVLDLAPLGALVTSTVTTETTVTVGTTVSSIETDCQSFTQRLQTDWAELDFSGGR